MFFISTKCPQKWHRNINVIWFCKIVTDKTLFKTLSLYMDFYPLTKCNCSPDSLQFHATSMARSKATPLKYITTEASVGWTY